MNRENKKVEILENLAAAVYTCDKDGYITFYNKAAVALWGREPVIGKELWCGSWKIFKPDGITPLSFDLCPMAIALKEGRSVRSIEIVVERPDGEKKNIMPRFRDRYRPGKYQKSFSRFFRAHGPDDGMLSSMGLGLYISADIIRRHKGKIWVDSKVGEGSTFHFSLPK